MKPIVKAGLVGAGYVIAFAMAAGIVAIHVATTNGLASQGASGMYAFGDGLLFGVVFAVASVPATVAGLFFLRPYRMFWSALSVGALLVVLTGVAALMDYVASRTAAPHSWVQDWSALAVLRILVAPLFASAFLLSGVLAPNRSARIVLLVAAGLEVLVFGCVALTWLRPY